MTTEFLYGFRTIGNKNVFNPYNSLVSYERNKQNLQNLYTSHKKAQEEETEIKAEIRDKYKQLMTKQSQTIGASSGAGIQKFNTKFTFGKRR